MTALSTASVLCLSLSEVSRDPRVLRQVAALESVYSVTSAGLGDEEVATGSSIRVVRRPSRPLRKLAQGSLLVAHAYKSEWYSKPHVRKIRANLQSRRFDLVLANDLLTLPMAFEIAGGAPVVLDAHEYSPRQGEERWEWRRLQQPRVLAWCREYLPHLAGMMTVSEGLAAEYRRNFGVDPIVIRNAPAFIDQEPSPLEPGRIRMVHHGVATPARRPELMIELMELLDDRFTLDLMFAASDAGYVRRLRTLAQHSNRIRFVPPVPTLEIAKTINGYDIGLYLLPPTNFNFANALPNKFFEFVQGRLCVAIGPSPEMASLTRAHGIGVVAEDFTPASLATRLNALSSEEIAAFKSRTNMAASMLNAETEAERIRVTVATALLSPFEA